jgi:hypothetical protein
VSGRARTNRAPRWLRELAEGCRYGSAAQSPSRVSELVRDAARTHGLPPEEVARMVARHWLARGWVRSTQLPVE